MSREVRRNQQLSRYEVVIDGQVAGFADYEDRDGVREMPHTVTSPAFRGQGIAAEVVAATLDDAREQGLRVVPSCSYVADYVRKNPAYADLVR